MSEEKTYSIKEIAEALNVPRTTVTDWISRYPQYMEFRLQGKRRVYTEAAVNVLKEISVLRNQGLSSFRIEEQLGGRYSGFAKRNQLSETAVKTGLESHTSYRHIFALLFLVVLLLCAGIIAFLKIETFIRENQKLNIKAEDSSSGLKSADDNSKESRMEVYDLEKQKDEFKKAVLKMQEKAESVKEAEILLLRNKFAEERLELLKALDAAQKNREEMEAIITQIQAQCYEH